jgi:hypothetical protein
MASRNESLTKAVLYGVGSIALFYVLFLYADKTVEWAALTREGHKAYFLIPIAIPFIFSIVHGAFTGYFWDALGMKPAQKNSKK